MKLFSKIPFLNIKIRPNIRKNVQDTKTQLQALVRKLFHYLFKSEILTWHFTFRNGNTYKYV